mgnify:CR=1 FL=1
MTKNLIFIKAAFSSILIFGAVSCGKTSKDDSTTNELPKKDSIVKVESDSTAKKDLAENIKKVITTKYLKPEDLKVIDSAECKFSYQEIDLNNDGKKEVLINFFTPYFCGSGGCSLALLDSDLNIVNRFTVTEIPLFISPDTKNGWKVIYTKSRGQWKALEYENGKYPSNPSVVKDSKAEPDAKSISIFRDQNQSKIYNF